MASIDSIAMGVGPFAEYWGQYENKQSNDPIICSLHATLANKLFKSTPIWKLRRLS